MNGSTSTNGSHENVVERAISSGAEFDGKGSAHWDSAGLGLNPSALGEPLSIHDVAALLGCSAWTVRQRYLPQGLPHLRACAGGRIVFFREQVIAWILKRQQQKGGTRK